MRASRRSSSATCTVCTSAFMALLALREVGLGWSLPFTVKGNGGPNTGRNYARLRGLACADAFEIGNPRTFVTPHSRFLGAADNRAGPSAGWGAPPALASNSTLKVKKADVNEKNDDFLDYSVGQVGNLPETPHKIAPTPRGEALRTPRVRPAGLEDSPRGVEVFA